MKIRDFIDTDVKEVLQLHFDAAHETAKDDYPKEILDKWSPPIDDDRIKKFLSNPDNEIRIVAIDDDGSVSGFGCVIPSISELRACYVLPAKGGQGVGQKIMQNLEKIAVEQGATHLKLDSSITAKVFYERCGYKVLSKASHPMRLGGHMDCYKMRKEL